MRVQQPAKLLRLHFSERDRYNSRPLYEAVVDKCRELHIAGATVFRGMEGFGDSTEIHRARLVGGEAPIVVQIVDTAEKIAALLPAVEQMIDRGLIAMSDVEAIRVQKS